MIKNTSKLLSKKLVIKTNSNSSEKIELDNKTLKEASYLLRAIKHPLRFATLGTLKKKKQMNVTQIDTHLKLGINNTSSHLAILRKAGVVETKRQGQKVFYSLNQPRIADIARIIGQLN